MTDLIFLEETFRNMGVDFKMRKPDAFKKVSLDLGNGYWFTFNSEGKYVGTYNLYPAPEGE